MCTSAMTIIRTRPFTGTLHRITTDTGQTTLDWMTTMITSLG